MSLFNMFSKSLEEKVSKYFKEKQISLKKQDDKFYFDLYFPEEKYTLTPYYFVASSNLITFMVNIKKYENINIDLYNKINEFNLKSEFFKAQIENNLLYLHYECFIDGNEKDIIGVILTSLNPVSQLINEF